MDVSIVIPSYQGESRLPDLLQCLKEQKTQFDWEAIVVLDGSTDGSEALLNEWVNRIPMTVIARRDNLGRSHTLNEGFDAARGTVLIRCDDDLLPTPDYVETFATLILRSPGHGVVGLYRNLYPDNPYSQLYGRPVDRRFRDEAYSAPLERRWIYWAGNCGVHRDAWESVGPYDEDFREYGWEDIDWGYRLAQSGGTICLDPKLETLHRVAATTVATRIDRARASGKASVRFYNKHSLQRPLPPGGSWGLMLRVASPFVGPRSATSLDSMIAHIPPRYARILVDLAVQASYLAGVNIAEFAREEH